MIEQNYVAYMVGDENIALGALVAFHSFQKNNPGIECRLYSYPDKLDPKYKQYLVDNGVKIFDISEFSDKMSDFNAQASNGMTWPVEIFLNHYLPYVLSEEFTYGMKLDYDLLVLDTLDLEEITPVGNETMATINNLFNCYNMNKIRLSEELYLDNFDFDFERLKSIGVNCGFLVVDLKKYKELDIYGKMINLYNKVKSIDVDAAERIYSEQGLLNLTLEDEKIEYRLLDSKYNLTTTMCRVHKGEDIKIMHYTGIVKPWSKFDLTEDLLTKKGHMNVFMSYYWLKYVDENLPFIKCDIDSNFDQKMMRAILDLYQSTL